jgi:hypothetical protein
MKTASPAAKGWASNALKQAAWGAAKTAGNMSRFTGDPSSAASAVDFGIDEQKRNKGDSASQAQVPLLQEGNQLQRQILEEMKNNRKKQG